MDSDPVPDPNQNKKWYVESRSEHFGSVTLVPGMGSTYNEADWVGSSLSIEWCGTVQVPTEYSAVLYRVWSGISKRGEGVQSGMSPHYMSGGEGGEGGGQHMVRMGGGGWL